jgi:hypothetical protein
MLPASKVAGVFIGGVLLLVASGMSAESPRPSLKVGDTAPEFRVTKLDGSAVALSDLRGKRVLINSWATW